MPSKYPEFANRPIRTIYSMAPAPVHSVMLVHTQEEALSYPTGEIELGFCEDNGFIVNLAFDHTLQHYCDECEETQGFSPTFTKFHEGLARQVIDRFDLRGKKLIEIGCGKGDFLNMLCEMGDNSGIGFDPAYVAERDPYDNDKVEFVTELYSAEHTKHASDFICCKMTLEHIPDVVAFVSMVRKSIPEGHDCTVFFQIPEVRRVLSDVAFWDIYYEHCSYFSKGSLARVFRAAGFRVDDLWTDYDDQYLMIAASPAQPGEEGDPLPQEETIEELTAEVNTFQERVTQRLDDWRTWIRDSQAQGKKTVLWGGGSKAVAFLTTLGIRDEIQYAVDVNPHKEGTWIVGTGQQVVGPAFLADYKPDQVVVMNPVYREEIAADLQKLGLAPELVMIDCNFSQQS